MRYWGSIWSNLKKKKRKIWLKNVIKQNLNSKTFGSCFRFAIVFFIKTNIKDYFSIFSHQDTHEHEHEHQHRHRINPVCRLIERVKRRLDSASKPPPPRRDRVL